MSPFTACTCVAVEPLAAAATDGEDKAVAALFQLVGQVEELLLSIKPLTGMVSQQIDILAGGAESSTRLLSIKESR